MAITRRHLRELAAYAKDGDRLITSTPDGTVKTAWGGLGNRSGLHSHADVMTRDKWEKSGKGLVKKLVALPPGSTVEVQQFRNKTRDRVAWHKVQTYHVDETPTPACYHLELDNHGCKSCGVELDVYSVSPIL